MKEIVKEIFKKLDGCTCFVKSGGLIVQGSMEGECKLQYNDYRGLKVMTPLKWNDIKPQELVLPTLNRHLSAINKEEDKKLEPISFDARDQILDELQELISNLWTVSAYIYPYGVTNISFSSRENTSDLYSVEIQYEKDTIILSSIKPKNENT